MEGCIKRISWLKSAKEVIDFRCHDDIRRYIYRLREHYIILLRIFFLSVERNATEKEYFEGISANRRLLGINAVVDVQVLHRRRNDTNSAPQQVVELLEEYIRLRECGDESIIEDIPYSFVEKY